MKLFPTLPTDLGNRCDNYHISTATTTTGMNEFLRNKQPNEVGPIRRAKGAKSSRQNQTSGSKMLVLLERGQHEICENFGHLRLRLLVLCLWAKCGSPDQDDA